MALQAETLVEEWFNRNGYFSMRGIKDKIDEIDILAVKSIGQGKWECIHCEVQVSMRPVTYISNWTKELMNEFNIKTKTSAKKRTDEQVSICAKEWVRKKFTVQKKRELRQKVHSDGKWKYMFVHGNVKDTKELDWIASENVEVVSLKRILDDLCTKKTELDVTGSSAGDLVEILNFMDNK